MSIIEVANLAEVSKSTVSRVINNEPGVSSQAIRAVQIAMQQIGYQPSARRPGRKPLSTRGLSTGTVAFLALGRDPAQMYRMPVFPSLMHGVERALALRGASMVLAGVSESGPLPVAISGRMPDGVLLVGKHEKLSTALRDRLAKVPCIWLMREHNDDENEFDHVFYNNRAVGALAARFLKQRGHTHVGLFNSQSDEEVFAQRRIDFVAAGEKVGLQVQLFTQTDRTSVPEAQAQTLIESRTGEVLDRVLHATPRPTALFVTSDLQLPSLYRELRRRQLEPYRDIDLISCDNDLPTLSALDPTPATIDIHLDVVAHQGVEQLFSRLRRRGGRPRVTQYVEPTLALPRGMRHP